MTRFMMTLEDAVNLVLFAFENGNSGDIFVQKSPSTTIGELASTMKKYIIHQLRLKILGFVMLKKFMKPYYQREERIVAEELKDYFRIPSDNRDLKL
jgi:UDP-N-acetylglucosamine 4,6-dehydratase